MTIDTLKVAVQPSPQSGSKTVSGDDKNPDASSQQSFSATLAAQSQRAAANESKRPDAGTNTQTAAESGKRVSARDDDRRAAPGALPGESRADANEGHGHVPHAGKRHDDRPEIDDDPRTPMPAWLDPGVMPARATQAQAQAPGNTPMNTNGKTVSTVDAQARRGIETLHPADTKTSTRQKGSDAARSAEALSPGVATPAQRGIEALRAGAAAVTTPDGTASNAGDPPVEVAIANARALVGRHAELTKETSAFSRRPGVAPSADAAQRSALHAGRVPEAIDVTQIQNSRVATIEGAFRIAKRTLSTPGDTPSATAGVHAGAVSTHSTAAPMTTPAAQAPSLAAAIAAPLGSETWSQALNQQALRLSHFGDGTAELTLHPRDLGKLHVSLKMGEQAQLHFASPHADVRAAVESALPQLRHAFADSGINLGQTSVSDQGQNHGQGGADSSPGSRHALRALAGRDDGQAGEDITAVPARIISIAGRTLAGGIDIFA